MTETKTDDDLFGAEHVRVYRETDGEHGYHWRGTDILLLTTTGRKTGEQRTTPLIHRTDGDDRWVLIASQGGAPDDPSWFKNMVADPEATIQVKGDVIPVQMSTASGDERTRLWEAMSEVWPAYDKYQARTDREIPVVVLTRR